MPLRREDKALIVHKHKHRSKLGVGRRNPKEDSLALVRAGLCVIGAAIKFPLWVKSRKNKVRCAPILLHSSSHPSTAP